ncbi:hypothetical protein [Salinisphaera hydrothermalis]|uniref:DUF4376 domain-containing protein n=1 Tax=Salinisphaera hydrothermalis TaxID=563188 RepID=UPI003341391E
MKIEAAPDGTTTATAPNGSPLNAPDDLTPYTPPKPTAADQLAAAQSAKIAEINAACEAAIVSGFTSDALGKTYTYRSRRDDQVNLMGAAMSGTDTQFKCADADGLYAMRDHTAAQIKQVFADGVARKLALIEQSNALTDEVNAIAPDDDAPIEAVHAITWSAPTKASA